MNINNGSKLAPLPPIFSTILVLIFISLFTSTKSYAVASDKKPWLIWHSTNLQLLYGAGFKLGDKKRTFITAEHANKWRYGDNYLFIDHVLDSDTKDYVEWRPRLSFSKITGKQFSLGPIKDVLLAGTLEMPEDLKNRRLIGLGFDWNVPGLTFFKTNIYRRDDPTLDGTTWGTTFAWGGKFNIKHHKLLLSGFWDMAGSEGGREAYQLISPALLLDIGHYHGLSNTMYLGVEYQYWHNKFGLAGVTESFAQLEFRWVL